MMVAYCGDSRLVGVTFLASPSQRRLLSRFTVENPVLARQASAHCRRRYSLVSIRAMEPGRSLPRRHERRHPFHHRVAHGPRERSRSGRHGGSAHGGALLGSRASVLPGRATQSIHHGVGRERGRVHTFDVREAEDHYAEVTDIVKDVPEEELAQLSTMKDGLEDVGCAVVNMRRRARPPSFDEIKTWAHIDPVERRAIWKTSFLEGDVLKDFSIQTVNNLRGFQIQPVGRSLVYASSASSLRLEARPARTRRTSSCGHPVAPCSRTDSRGACGATCQISYRFPAIT